MRVVHYLLSVAIVEVDRLWLRFQQLGCNEDGVLELEVLDRPPASNNIFAKHASNPHNYFNMLLKCDM